MEREREKEKHQCVVASRSPPTWAWPTTQAFALTGNQSSDPLIHRLAFHPQNHISQGPRCYFKWNCFLSFFFILFIVSDRYTTNFAR